MSAHVHCELTDQTVKLSGAAAPITSLDRPPHRPAQGRREANTFCWGSGLSGALMPEMSHFLSHPGPLNVSSPY